MPEEERQPQELDELREKLSDIKKADVVDEEAEILAEIKRAQTEIEANPERTMEILESLDADAKLIQRILEKKKSLFGLGEKISKIEIKNEKAKKIIKIGAKIGGGVIASRLIATVVRNTLHVSNPVTGAITGGAIGGFWGYVRGKNKTESAETWMDKLDINDLDNALSARSFSDEHLEKAIGVLKNAIEDSKNGKVRGNKISKINLARKYRIANNELKRRHAEQVDSEEKSDVMKRIDELSENSELEGKAISEMSGKNYKELYKLMTEQNKHTVTKEMARGVLIGGGIGFAANWAMDYFHIGEGAKAAHEGVAEAKKEAIRQTHDARVEHWQEGRFHEFTADEIKHLQTVETHGNLHGFSHEDLKNFGQALDKAHSVSDLIKLSNSDLHNIDLSASVDGKSLGQFILDNKEAFLKMDPEMQRQILSFPSLAQEISQGGAIAGAAVGTSALGVLGLSTLGALEAETYCTAHYKEKNLGKKIASFEAKSGGGGGGDSGPEDASNPAVTPAGGTGTQPIPIRRPEPEHVSNQGVVVGPAGGPEPAAEPFVVSEKVNAEKYTPTEEDKKKAQEFYKTVDDEKEAKAFIAEMVDKSMADGKITLVLDTDQLDDYRVMWLSACKVGLFEKGYGLSPIKIEGTAGQYTAEADVIKLTGENAGATEAAAGQAVVVPQKAVDKLFAETTEEAELPPDVDVTKDLDTAIGQFKEGLEKIKPLGLGYPAEVDEFVFFTDTVSKADPSAKHLVPENLVRAYMVELRIFGYDTPTNWLENNVEAVKMLLKPKLAELGYEMLDEERLIGTSFSTRVCDSMGTEAKNGAEENEIVRVWKPGFTYEGKVKDKATVRLGVDGYKIDLERKSITGASSGDKLQPYEIYLNLRDTYQFETEDGKAHKAQIKFAAEGSEGLDIVFDSSDQWGIPSDELAEFLGRYKFTPVTESEAEKLEADVPVQNILMKFKKEIDARKGEGGNDDEANKDLPPDIETKDLAEAIKQFEERSQGPIQDISPETRQRLDDELNILKIIQAGDPSKIDEKLIKKSLINKNYYSFTTPRARWIDPNIQFVRDLAEEKLKEYGYGLVGDDTLAGKPFDNSAAEGIGARAQDDNVESGRIAHVVSRGLTKDGELVIKPSVLLGVEGYKINFKDMTLGPSAKLPPQKSWSSAAKGEEFCLSPRVNYVFTTEDGKTHSARISQMYNIGRMFNIYFDRWSVQVEAGALTKFLQKYKFEVGKKSETEPSDDSLAHDLLYEIVKEEEGGPQSVKSVDLESPEEGIDPFKVEVGDSFRLDNTTQDLHMIQKIESDQKENIVKITFDDGATVESDPKSLYRYFVYGEAL